MVPRGRPPTAANRAVDKRALAPGSFTGIPLPFARWAVRGTGLSPNACASSA